MSTSALERSLDRLVREAAISAASAVHARGVHRTLAIVPAHRAVDRLVARRRADLSTIIAELTGARSDPGETA